MKKILNDYPKTYYPFHMPGHKQGRLNPLSGFDLFGMDVTETQASDDLYHPENFIKESLDYTQQYYDTKKTYYLVGGSTAGIMMAISACTHKGDKVLIPRNVHHSVYNALIAQELSPRYLIPEYDEGLMMYCGINPQTVEKALNQEPDISCVIITSPTYEGVISDIEAIAKIVHSYDKILIVDEAHGAHLSFYDFTPKSALEMGADIVVQSLHKTLPALTQTALIHVNGDRVDLDRLGFYYQMYQTSSPSFVLLASIDACIRFMAEKSLAKQVMYKELLQHFRDSIKDISGLELLSKDYFKRQGLHIFDTDPTRLVFLGNHESLDGIKLAEDLYRRFNIIFEMASLNYIVGISTLADQADGFTKLYDALSVLGNSCYKKQGNFDIIKLGNKVFDPYETIDKVGEFVDLESALGRVSKAYIKVYPPSIPLVVPGEEINQTMIGQIKAFSSLNIQGVVDGKVEVIK